MRSVDVTKINIEDFRYLIISEEEREMGKRKGEGNGDILGK
jgi:hypothetical protein